MARYIGTGANIGVFEKQTLTLDGIDNEFPLLFRAGSATALLVLRNDIFQEAGVDYTLSQGGSHIFFSFTPPNTDSIYIIYLGRELSVPAVAGLQPFHFTAVGNGIITTFTLSQGPLIEQGLQVYADGVLQHYTDDWTVSGFDVIFTLPPANGVKLDFYIHGIERSDLLTVDDHSITGVKLEIGIDIGTSLNPAGDIYATSLVLSGDLVVNGTTTTLNTTNLDVTNTEITLNSDFTSGVPFEDCAIRIKRGSSDDALLEWVESSDYFVAGTSGDLQKIIRNTEFQSHVTNFSNPHAVTNTQVGLGNVTNDAQLKRSANDFTFTTISSIADDDLYLLEDASDAGNKKTVEAQDILSPTINGDHAFTGNITFGGTVSFGSTDITESIDDFETLNNTPQAAITIPLDDDTAYFFEAKVIARNTNNLSNQTYWTKIEGAVRRNNAGGATLVGTTFKKDDDENSTGYTASVDVSGNDLLVNVTGGATDTVHWTARITLSPAV